MGIRWNYSDKGTHKMWFQCRNSDNKARSTLLVDKPSSATKYQRTDATKGYNYYLYTKREHIIDPSIYVSGTWQP